MPPYTIHLAATLAALILTSSLASAAAIDVAGRKIVVIQPEGHCWLDMNGSENMMAQQAATNYSNTGQELLVMFADCKELSALRAGKTTTFRRHGNLAAFTSRAGVVLPTKKSRSEVLSAQAASLERSTGRSIDSVVQQANKTLPGTILEMSTPRPIHRDQNAIYIAALVRARSSMGVNWVSATVVAFTVLNGIQTNVVLYDEAKAEPYDFAPLLQRSKGLAAELVKLNP